MKTTVLLLGLPAAFAATGDRCSVGTNGAILAFDAGALDSDGKAFTDATKKEGQQYFDKELNLTPIQNPPVIMKCASADAKLASLNVLEAMSIDKEDGECTTATCSCYSASLSASISVHQFLPEDGKSTGVTYAGTLKANMYACGKMQTSVPVSLTQKADGEEVFSDAMEDTPKDGGLKCYSVTGTDDGLKDDGMVDGPDVTFAFERCICNSVSDTAICNNADKGVAQEPVPCTTADVGVKEGCLAAGDDVKVTCTQAMEDDATDKNCATGSTGKTVVVQQPASGVAAGTDNAKAPAAKAPGSNGNGASSATVGYSMLVVAAAVALKA